MLKQKFKYNFTALRGLDLDPESWSALKITQDTIFNKASADPKHCNKNY